MTQRVKGGYKNRITAERNRSTKLEGKLSLHQEFHYAVKADTDYLKSLIISVILSSIFLSIFGLDFMTVLKTSACILVIWSFMRIFKTSRIKVRLNEMEDGEE